MGRVTDGMFKVEVLVKVGLSVCLMYLRSVSATLGDVLYKTIWGLECEQLGQGEQGTWMGLINWHNSYKPITTNSVFKKEKTFVNA